MKKTHALVYFLLCMCLVTFSVYGTSAQQPPSTFVAVDPQVSTPTFGSTFSVNVNVTNIVNFTSWQLNLYYLNSVLNCTDAVEGPFLNSSGSPYADDFGKTINNNFNSTYGCLLAYDTVLGNYAVNGGGVILTVTFKALGGGSTSLTLYNTILGDNEEPSKSIPHVDYSGAVNVIGAIHDVAVTNVTSKTVVGQGYVDNIGVTAANPGAYTETFNVTVYANTTEIGTQTVNNTSSGTSTLLNFTWSTVSLAVNDTCAISAYASPVPGETNTANNNFTFGYVTVAIVGDLTGKTASALDFVPDGKVDMRDVSVVAKFFGQYAPPAPSNCDVTGPTPGVPDGKVDMRDVGLVAKHFGQHQ